MNNLLTISEALSNPFVYGLGILLTLSIYTYLHCKEIYGTQHKLEFRSIMVLFALSIMWIISLPVIMCGYLVGTYLEYKQLKNLDEKEKNDKNN